MTAGTFSERRRSAVRDRAARLGPELLLADRAFDEVVQRIGSIKRPLRDAILIGCPSVRWIERLQQKFDNVRIVEPGAGFATAAGVAPHREIGIDLQPGGHDIAIAIGTLDTVNELPLALRQLGYALRPGTVLIGALAGGNSLPALRAALIEGERADGAIAQRIHPRIDAPTLANLLSSAGFEHSVVDVDRVTLRYPSFAALVRDLRAMGATSQLTSAPALSRRSAERAAAAFEALATDGKTAETIEILHFTSWVPETGTTPR